MIGLGSTIGAAKFSLTPLPFVLARGLSGLIVVVFGRIMPARTVPGARALEQVLGFEEFLRRVEENYERVVKTPEMFERFLPFAMAFGVERKWAKAFQGHPARAAAVVRRRQRRVLRSRAVYQPDVGSVDPSRERDDLVAAELGRIGVQRRIVRWGFRGRRWGRVLTW